MTDILPQAARWRLAALLVSIQTLALLLLCALILHQQRGFLLDLQASRIAVWTGDIELAAQTGHRNGLALAEMRALGPLLRRLPQVLPEVRTAQVYALGGESTRVLFALDAATSGQGVDRRLFLPAARGAELWRKLGDDGLIHLGRQLRDDREQVVGGYFITADSARFKREIAAAEAAFLPFALAAIALAAVFTGWVLALSPWARGKPPAGRFNLQRRLMLLAFVVVAGAGAAMVWHAGKLFSVNLQPAIEAKAQAVAQFLQYKLQRAGTLGVPFDRLRGVDAYFADNLQQHRELLALRLIAADGSILVQAGRNAAGSSRNTGAITRAIDPGYAKGARIEAVIDPERGAQSMKAVLADLGIVLLVALLVFNEALRALLAKQFPASGDAAPSGAHSLAAIRLPLFLLILTEELTRSFLPLHIRTLASEKAAGALWGTSTAIGLPMSVYMVFFAVSTPLAGMLADRIGPARTFAAGACLTAAGFFWAAVGGDFWQFTATRALCAIGYAFATMACQRMILASTDAATRAQGLSLLIGAVGVAAICGSSIGGVIAERLGARSVFALSALVALLGLALMPRRKRDAHAVPPAEAPQARQDAAFAFADLGRLIAQPSFALLMLAAAIPAKIALAGFLFYLAPLTLSHAGYSPAAIGRAVMLYFIVISALNPLASRWSDRSGWRWLPVIAGGAIMGAGGLAGILFPGMGLDAAVLVGILALGVGTGLSAAPLQALASEIGRTQGRLAPMAAIAAFRTIERLGSAIGPMLAGIFLLWMAFDNAMAAIGAIVLASTLMLPIAPLLLRRQDRGPAGDETARP